jgi:hypothetical protein
MFFFAVCAETVGGDHSRVLPRRAGGGGTPEGAGRALPGSQAGLAIK